MNLEAPRASRTARCLTPFGIRKAVEHLGSRLGDSAALEGLATFHYMKAAYEAGGRRCSSLHERQMDFSVQAERRDLRATKNFTPSFECSRSRDEGRRRRAGHHHDRSRSFRPLVPAGELVAGARPHFKLIYSPLSAGWQNQAILRLPEETGTANALAQGDYRVRRSASTWYTGWYT